MPTYIDIKNLFKYRYNLKFRKFFDQDLNLINTISKEKYPFYPCSSNVHIINALKWLYHSNQLVGGKGFPSKFRSDPSSMVSIPSPSSSS